MTETDAGQCRPSGDTNDAEPSPQALVHDINNVTGRLLSTLYLCLSDIEPDHPVHGRLQVANSTSLELRSLIQRLENALSG
ncbi:hypothetical protein [Thalassobaculum litoreum]|uniref:Uncharacterized protein n=1 Tax=Thalassobaculum litoreum DSM 18839 TaxID=1123362 RepID=A0A8G2BJW9_9PROT|nr:hypothetical protein [Thalassobaculum litoreum]SDF88983.1 hypothetical protein SAMN05660686_02703 [Thalassobaculum litoreum DSM 18839]